MPSRVARQTRFEDNASPLNGIVEGEGLGHNPTRFCQLHQSPLLRPFAVAPAVELGNNCMF